MSTKRLVICIALLSIFAMAARISMDTDTWWHLRAGEWMIENKAILQQDLFSFTRYGEEWHYPGWIMEIPMYLIYRYFGPGGLNIWTAAMVVTAFCFLWGVLSGGLYLRAFLIILAATASGVYWSARPHLLTFVLTAATLFILEKNRWSDSSKHRKRLFWLPVFMLLWVNGHGGFAIGFILWGIYWLAQQIDWISDRSYPGRIRELFNKPGGAIKNPDFTLTLVGLLMLLSVGMNPSGFEMINYPFKTLAIGALKDYIQEWQSPDFHSINVQPFFWLILLGFTSVGLSRQRLVFTDFMLFATFCFLGLSAGRNIALFSLVAPVVISRHFSMVIPEFQLRFSKLANLSETKHKDFRLVNLIILFIICLAVIAKISLVIPAEANFREFKKILPIEAVEYLNHSGINGRMFNPYNWGGFLIWSTPVHPVFIDGRTDLYNDEIIKEWLKIVRVEKGWEKDLELYGVEVILTETGSSLAKSLEQNAQWVNLYQDQIAVIYRHKGRMD